MQAEQQTGNSPVAPVSPWGPAQDAAQVCQACGWTKQMILQREKASRCRMAHELTCCTIVPCCACAHDDTWAAVGTLLLMCNYSCRYQTRYMTQLKSSPGGPWSPVAPAGQRLKMRKQSSIRVQLWAHNLQREGEKGTAPVLPGVPIVPADQKQSHVSEWCLV